MNNDIDNVDILPLLDTGYALKTIANGQNAVFRNGRLVYIILDIDKPGKYFFDLRSVFNASTGEGGKSLNIMFMNNAVPWQLNGKTVGIDGAYPSGERFHVTGSENQANSSLVEFNFPLGLFQEAGVYKFQFEIRDESGNLATSHYCFFQVTQNATLLAADWKNGVNPFDSDYTEWKDKVEKQINALSSQLTDLGNAATQTKDLLNQYVANAQGYVQSEFTKLLGQENHWTGRQSFDGGATASDLSVGGGISVGGQIYTSGDIKTDGSLTVGNSANLPGNTILNTDVLAYENGNLSAGLFPCEGYWLATTDGACVSSSLVNGVIGYISAKKFRYTPRDGDVETALFEIHMNCTIPTSAFGKPVMQFAGDFSGIDQTPFAMGGHIFQFDASAKTLNCNGYMPGNSSTSAMDAGMI